MKTPAPGRSSTRLTPGQRRLYLGILGTGILLSGNTLYLLASRAAAVLGLDAFVDSPTHLPLISQVMLLAHLVLGLGLCGLALPFVLGHIRQIWSRRHPWAVRSGLAIVGSGLALLVSGLLLLQPGRSASRLLALHAAAAALLLLTFLGHRHRSISPIPRDALRRVLAGSGLFCLLALAIHAGSRSIATPAQPEERSGPGPAIPGTRFIPATFVSPDSPFFPAAVTTSTGRLAPDRVLPPADPVISASLEQDLAQSGFASKTWIGAATCQPCHADIAAQWSTSAHRYASFDNPFYEASVEAMRQDVGFARSKWCAGCHDPALLLAGRMDAPIDRQQPQSQAGLTCLACHSIDRIHNSTGNGNYNIADGQDSPYLFAGIGIPELLPRLAHQTLVLTRPEAHRREMLKPFFRESGFCGACHKVSVDTEINDYRWLRGQNDFDSWHDSGVSGNSARAFYSPQEARSCQDCHMPLEPTVLGDAAAQQGKVRSHRFLGANTALPSIRGDIETLRRTEAFLRQDRLRVEIFALRRESEPDRPTMALAETRPTLVPGETVQFDVVIRNQGVGHTFPGGTNDSNEGWLELEVTDPAGRLLAQSGFLRPDGHVDPGAHFFRAVLLDRHAQPIRQRNVHAIHTPVYANLIHPGNSDLARFRLRIPGQGISSLRLRARVLWRKFDRTFTQFVFRTNPTLLGRFGGQTPELPITELARHELVLPVSGSAHPALQEELKPESWVRFNDYGIATLLQGESRLADQAFAQVTRLRPDRTDGPRNQARAALLAGNLSLAFQYLEQAEQLQPGDPRTAWDQGNALTEDGRFDDAAEAFRRVLADFPQDRAAWRNLGRALYLGGHPKPALAAFEKVLAIDPEDRIAHYHRMLLLQSQQATDLLPAAQQAYLKYKPDEAATELARSYRQAHPDDHRESQRLHLHDLRIQE